MSGPLTSVNLVAAQCQSMSGFLVFLIDDPNLNPYAAESIAAIQNLATGSTGLLYMQSQVLGGELDPTLAQLRIMSYLATYAPILTYYYVTDFVFQMQRWTSYTMGPEFANIWDGMIPTI